jgi:5-formyltetrahydrofolate cyclo-ligase
MSSKKLLRDAAHARRKTLAMAIPDFASRLAAHAKTLGFPERSIVGGYVALPGEADPGLLLVALRAAGHDIALPRVESKGAPLVFHLWQQGQPLRPGAFNIPEPQADRPIAHPRILLVPLLAFDARGHRLGYGGGYYDRTLENLRAKGPVRAIGIAYSGQEIEAIPDENHDRLLDIVVTENGIRNFHHT